MSRQLAANHREKARKFWLSREVSLAHALLDNEAMRKIELGFVSMVAAAGLMAGCKQSVESTDIRTTGVFPVVDVSADASGNTRVLVKLKVGGPAANTYLDLTGPDSLTATMAGVTRPLDSSGSVGYATTFQTNAAGPVVIAFLRGPADTSAPNTTVNMPEPFSLTLGATEVSRASGSLAVTWTPAGTANMDSSMTGPCVGIVSGPIPASREQRQRRLHGDSDAGPRPERPGRSGVHRGR
jgi:hypothetical protein